MNHTTEQLTRAGVRGNRGITPKLARVKARLRRHKITAWDVALAAGVSDAYVWMVINGRRRSPKVLEAAERLLAERRGAK